MERKIISHRIGSILDDISRLSNALYAMDTTDIQRYPDNYEVLSTDAALRAEKIACRLRHLIYSSTTIRKGDYLTSAGIVHGIEVVYEDGVLEVTLPGLLPKRKQRQNTEFLLDPFYFSLEQYAKEHPMPRFSDCVVCFTQVYDQCLPTRRIRDYDNLEEKQLLDVLSTFVMADDTGLLCDAYNTAALGEKDCTRISVMEKKRFPAWLAEHDAALRAEKIACRLRHLIYSSTTIRKGDYLTSAGIVHGIEVVYEDGVLEVTLPGLLPKRKQRQNTEFLLDPFYFSLEQYAKEHPMPRFSDCVVCFTQVYDQCLPTRRIRDYDNLEEKQLLDVLSTFVMADDTGLLCDAYNTAALGEKDCTRISVMEKKRFPAWLAEHENTLKSISDF